MRQNERRVLQRLKKNVKALCKGGNGGKERSVSTVTQERGHQISETFGHCILLDGVAEAENRSVVTGRDKKLEILQVVCGLMRKATCSFAIRIVGGDSEGPRFAAPDGKAGSERPHKANEWRSRFPRHDSG